MVEGEGRGHYGICITIILHITAIARTLYNMVLPIAQYRQEKGGNINLLERY